MAHRIMAHNTDTSGSQSAGSSENSELGELLSLLAKDRRRYALYCLSDTSSQRLAVEELVEELESVERSCRATEPSRTELALSLQHVHLPKLNDADVIEYDQTDGQIEYQGDDQLELWVGRCAVSELESDQQRSQD